MPVMPLKNETSQPATPEIDKNERKASMSTAFTQSVEATLDRRASGFILKKIDAVKTVLAPPHYPYLPPAETVEIFTGVRESPKTLFGKFLHALKVIYVLLERPHTSLIGFYTMSLIFCLIVVSCALYIVESMAESQEYSGGPVNEHFPADWPKGCSICAPVNLNSDNYVAEALIRSDARVVTYCRENEDDCKPRPKKVFFIMETLAVAVFTFEYLARFLIVWAIRCDKEISKGEKFKEEAELADSDEPQDIEIVYQFQKNKVWKRYKYFITDPMNMVDLVAILPYYMELLLGSVSSVTFVRILRLFRVVRLLKLSVVGEDTSYMHHFVEAIALFYRVFQQSSLALVLGMMYTFFMMILVASIIYLAEEGSWDPTDGKFKTKADYYLDEDVPSLFTSIPATFWWVLVTFTTVGYGDLYPSTGWGKFFGVIVMYLGIFFLAMPITIIGANFSDLYNQNQEKRKLDRENYFKSAKFLITCLLDSNFIIPLRAGWDQWVLVVNDSKQLYRIIRDELDRALAPVRRHIGEPGALAPAAAAAAAPAPPGLSAPAPPKPAFHGLSYIYDHNGPDVSAPANGTEVAFEQVSPRHPTPNPNPKRTRTPHATREEDGDLDPALVAPSELDIRVLSEHISEMVTASMASARSSLEDMVGQALEQETQNFTMQAREIYTLLVEAADAVKEQGDGLSTSITPLVDNVASAVDKIDGLEAKMYNITNSNVLGTVKEDAKASVSSKELAELKTHIHESMQSMAEMMAKSAGEAQGSAGSLGSADLTVLGELVAKECNDLRKENKEMFTAMVKVVDRHSKKTDQKLESLRMLVEGLSSSITFPGTVTERSYGIS